MGMRRNNSLSGINEESSSNNSKKRVFEESGAANARPGNKNKRGKSNFAAVSQQEDDDYHSQEEEKIGANDDDEEDAMSDYIDENFELDETDEYWGIGHLPCHELQPNFNDIRYLDQKNLPLKNDQQLKEKANYQYLDDAPQAVSHPIAPPMMAPQYQQPQFQMQYPPAQNQQDVQ